MSFSQRPSPVQDLENRLNARWQHISQARALAIQTRSALAEALRGADSEDSTIVVSGSLARDEFTPGSDIDWSLLIDGQADPDVIEILPRIENVINAIAAKPPGREGTFGTMAFSHELIHQIGGEDDTNRNTTRRILLLLESSPIGRPDAYERVVRSILQRYINEDDGFRRPSKYHVPRFLQNDFARYWRTMAVDFAYKRRSRFGRGTAMRNLKLRMSRKLIYVSGLLACFNCELKFNDRSGQPVCPTPVSLPECVACLRDCLELTPLEILATALLAFPHLDATARTIFDNYDRFLGMLSDNETRRRLEELPPDPSTGDALWHDARRITHGFRDGLLELFFDRQSRFHDLTRMYGVF